jgi:hypothetical protein
MGRRKKAIREVRKKTTAVREATTKGRSERQKCKQVPLGDGF